MGEGQGRWRLAGRRGNETIKTGEIRGRAGRSCRERSRGVPVVCAPDDDDDDEITTRGRRRPASGR